MRVTRECIEAAARLRAQLRGWDDADSVFAGLRDRFPSNSDRVHVLAKASAVDKLYSTRAGNIYWVANAVVRSTNEVSLAVESGVSLDAADVVNAISRHKRWLYPGSDRCASFASKYCHFFVDGWDFFIYDSFALAAVNDLLGTKQRGLTPKRTEYRDFCERVDRLIARDQLDATVAELDRYLWLWGQWINRGGSINREIRDLFESTNPRVQNDVARLAPVA